MDEVLPGVVRLREQREALTKHTILRAARELFAERGYANTPVRLLAQRAGVALQTVYATYGSKAGVLAGMPDLLDHEAGVVELFAFRDSIDDPVELVGLLAKIARQIRERCGDIIKIMRSGAAVDAAAVLAEGHRRRRLGALSILERIETLGALGLPRERAADIAVALSTDEVCDVLVDQGGWSYQEYEDWLKATLAKQLLRPPAP
ncbi:TetR/AcrR family transcriptional regulator [Kibdelosporangium aridum]|uniref:Transcriptional regulator, TetR family n=1 Tax=Kibdelosporangium aridum TaxID=2030 RepID=A0A1Y5XVS8_KIBAR|nr:TetR/AcrR family transcriptional regulator [Kibdelosporangium aridum]SMD15446.1 transcriptional regulator, TetR family [Kibdelosporangium aridum]